MPSVDGDVQHLTEQAGQQSISTDAALPDLATLKALHRQGDEERLQRACDRIMRSKASDPRLLTAVSGYYNLLGRPEQAVGTALRVVRTAPAACSALINLAAGLITLGRYELAAKACQHALALQPRSAEAAINLTKALHESGHSEEALRAGQFALQLAPRNPAAALGLAVVCLSRGDVWNGWRLYDGRLALRPPSRARNARTESRKPTWSGEPLQGRTLLVEAEQGLGDIIQFTQYVRRLERSGERVVFKVPDRLVALLCPAVAATLVIGYGDAEPAYDLVCPLLSLPGRLGLGRPSYTVEEPLLRAEAARCQVWQDWVGDHGFKVGICWQGNPKHEQDRHRSLGLRHFQPLAAVPGVRLISLQREHEAGQLAEVTFPVERPGKDFDTGPDAFLDAAGLIMNLDLVITIDSAIAHLSASLGRPTWLLLKKVPDWRWGLGGEGVGPDGPVRLFRQSARGDWTTVFRDVADALESAAATGRCLALPAGKADVSHSYPIRISPGEFIDRVTILEIKAQLIPDPVGRLITARELALLVQQLGPDGVRAFSHGATQMRRINGALWRLEERARALELSDDASELFCRTARMILRMNRQRARLKARINYEMQSSIAEIKSYMPVLGGTDFAQIKIAG